MVLASALLTALPPALAQGASALPEAVPPTVLPEAGAATPASGASPSGSSFDIRIQAVPELRALLEKHLQLQRYRAVSDLDMNELQRLQKLAEADARDLLGTLGYFNPDISISLAPLPASSAQEPAARPIILITVQAGPAARVVQARLDFSGEIATSTDEAAIRERVAIEKDWRLPAGQRFTQQAWDEAKTQALRQLMARRYPAGRIAYSLADVDSGAGAAHLALTLDSGPVYRLGNLQVTGVQRYNPLLAPRLARLSPGDVYDQRRLLEAQQRLASSGYFDSAYVSVDPAADPAAAPVQVQLREAKMQKVVLGVGLTTDSGPRASVEHLHNRALDTDWRATTKLQLESKSPSAQTEWTSLPDASYWRWVGLARAERQDDSELVTDAQRLRFGRMQTGERIDRNYYMQYDRSHVTGSGTRGSTDVSTGEGSALSANYAWTGRYFDTVPFPRQGYAFGFEVGGGSTLVGDRQPYVRALGRWMGITPVTLGRLALRAEAGAVLAKTDAPIPSTQLFKTGGDNSVRGYGLRDIGVALANGATGPGRYMGMASVEWQRPIVRGGLATDWESALFVDAGNVADAPQALRSGIAVGMGAGARWKSPIGPLQLDLAYGAKTRRFRLHMNVGLVF
jgi:translocation and assembly module TamA